MLNLLQVLFQWLHQKTRSIAKPSSSLSTADLDLPGLQTVSLKVGSIENNRKTENRPLQPIRHVRVEGALLVDFKCECTAQLTVSGNTWDVATLRTYYVEDTLVIEQKGTPREPDMYEQPLVVVLRLPNAPNITLLGSATVSMTNIDQPKLCLDIHGSGDIRAEGKVKNLEVAVQGAGDLNAKELIADKATISVQGAGDAKVAVRKEMRAIVQGSGSVVVHGQPPTRDVKVSGSGSIKFR